MGGGAGLQEDAQVSQPDAGERVSQGRKIARAHAGPTVRYAWIWEHVLLVLCLVPVATL